MGKFLIGPHSSKTYQAIVDSGLIDLDVDYVRRIVLDLEVGSPAKMYVEYFADDEKTADFLKAGLTGFSNE